MMLACSKCGAELNENATRCPVCGKTAEKYGLYRKIFEARHVVYVRQRGNM